MIGQIDLKDRNAVVIGGGQQALEKGTRMEQEGAQVTYIAKQFTQEFTEGLETIYAAKTDPRVCVQKSYEKTDIADAFLVYACTDDRILNHQIVLDANANRSLSASVHLDADAGFHAMKEEQFGRISVAVSTAGTYPAFWHVIMDDIRSRYEESYESRLELLAPLREKILTLPLEQEEKKMLLQELAYASCEELESKKLLL
ncbi:MAG: NAD(P)-dependent oxidoreductase [Hungatella sp.]